MNLIAFICRLLDCEDYELSSRLGLLSNRVLVEKALAGKKIYTIYGDKASQVIFHGLSPGDSRTHAYNGFLGITVQQHFYVRYRLKLAYPLLPLVVQIDNNNGHRSFYPLEMLIVLQEK